jgi:hypothetical protein
MDGVSEEAWNALAEWQERQHERARDLEAFHEVVRYADPLWCSMPRLAVMVEYLHCYQELACYAEIGADKLESLTWMPVREMEVAQAVVEGMQWQRRLIAILKGGVMDKARIKTPITDKSTDTKYYDAPAQPQPAARQTPAGDPSVRPKMPVGKMNKPG